MNVLIVDDHAIVRAGLHQMLVFDNPHITVGEAMDSVSAMQAIRTKKWDIVLLDINLPGKNGIEILKQIKQEFKILPVLMLSMHSEDQYALRSIKNGAAGYLTKDSAPEQLMNAIETIVSGKRFITPELADKLASAFGTEIDKPLHDELSDREFEVLCLLGKGISVTNIGKQLSLSSKTVSTYRTRILQKMGLKNSAEMIHYVIKNELNM